MKAETLRKLVKIIKVITLIVPLIIGVMTIAGSINKPGGDPIDDDPVPY